MHTQRHSVSFKWPWIVDSQTLRSLLSVCQKDLNGFLDEGLQQAWATSVKMIKSQIGSNVNLPHLGKQSEDPLKFRTCETATVYCVPKSRTHCSKHGLTESGSDNTRTTLRSTRGSVLTSHSSLSTCCHAKRRQARLQMVLNVEKRAGGLGWEQPSVLPFSSNQMSCITLEVSEGCVSLLAPYKVFGPPQVNTGPLEQISLIISL